MDGFITLLLAAAAAHGIAIFLRLPVIPIYLLAGFATRSWTGMDAGNDMWVTAVELGLVFLVFSVGVELNPKRISKQLKTVWLVGLVQFGALGILGYWIASLLGYGHIDSVYITFALSASSTLVVIRLLKQRQQMFEPYGRLVSGVLLLQDVFIMLILVVLLRMDQGNLMVALGLLQCAALGGLAWAAHRWFAPWFLIRVKQDEETLLLSILSILFAFLGLAWFLKLPLAVGAFLGGFVLSVFPVNGITRGMLSSLNGFFLAMFFVALGGLMVVPSLETLMHAAILGIFLIVVTVPLVTAVAEYTGLSARSAIESGLLLSQTSEFSMILVLQGWLLMHISHELFSMVVLMTVGTMALTPTLSKENVAHALMRWHPSGGSWWGLPENIKDHVLMLGYGSTGDYIANPVAERGARVVVVDEDAAIILRLNRKGFSAIRGDASDEAVLRKVYADRASLIMISVRRFSDAEIILQKLSGNSSKAWVRVFDAQQAKIVESLGATAIVGADQTVRKFAEWYDRDFISTTLEPSAK